MWKFFILLVIFPLLASLLVFSPYVTRITINQELLDATGFSLLGNFAFLLCCAGLGACFACIVLINVYVRNMTYEAKYEMSYWIKLILGTFSGLLLCELISVNDYFVVEASLIRELDKPLIAVFGGFGTVILHQYLPKMLVNGNRFLADKIKELSSLLLSPMAFPDDLKSTSSYPGGSGKSTVSEPFLPATNELNTSDNIKGGGLINDSEGLLPGQFTWTLEGKNKACCQKGHICTPGNGAGVVLSRGYDCKDKSPEEIIYDLSKAGMDFNTSSILAKTSGLIDDEAKQFLLEEQLSDVILPTNVQRQLFTQVWRKIETDVQQVCAKPDCVAAYGSVNWLALHHHIKEVLCDLQYCGHFTPLERKVIQAHVVNNDFSAFKEALCNPQYWPQVSEDRFNARKDYLVRYFKAS